MTQALTMRSPRRPGWGQTVRFILLLASVVVVLIPVYVLLVTSFKGSADADPSRTWYLPEVWVTKNWSNAWNQLSGGLLRSLALVIPSSIISAMLGSANGFVLSKWRFPGANVVFTLILFGMFIPYQAVMIPLMRLVTNADLGFGIHTLILMHVVYGIPITTLIFRNYYETIPNELIAQLRRGPHLAVHLRLERLSVRPVLRRRGTVRAGDIGAEQPGSRVDPGRLRCLHVRCAHRLGADPGGLHPAGQVLRRRPHGRLRQGLIPARTARSGHTPRLLSACSRIRLPPSAWGRQSDVM